MEPSELLGRVTGVLERLAIPYFVTGSIASIVYGEPRFTNDIDIVADLSLVHVEPFCASFPAPEYYVSAQAAREAVVLRRQFNIIHPGSGLKIDVIAAKDTEFDKGRFARARRIEIPGKRLVYFASPEDVVLKKLEFYREGGSEKHLRDIAGILKITGDRLDREYLRNWVGILGLEDIWRRISGPLFEGKDTGNRK